MNQELFQELLTNPASLEDMSLTELESFASRYPWMGAAHFLVSAKRMRHQLEDAETAVQKAALFYHQPLWLNYQLKRYTAQHEFPVELSTSTENIAASSLLAQEKASAEEKTPDLIFEPLHTVDYFASQGIKLKEEATDNDPLSQQVKSFTQWLRTMKKIYVEEETNLAPGIENEVILKADGSNANAEVITEAMAEVLVKQGKTQQAIDIYSKLSLRHPEKSHYFATRIETIKTTS